MPWVWIPGAYDFDLLLTDGAVDLDATWSSPYRLPTGQIQLDTPGDYQLDAHAGTFDTTIPFTISSTADAITAVQSGPFVPGRYSTICFTALDHSRKMIGDLEWTFSVDGDVETTRADTCVQFEPTVDQVGHTIEVIASAAGASLTLETLVSPR